MIELNKTIQVTYEFPQHFLLFILILANTEIFALMWRDAGGCRFDGVKMNL